MIDKIVNITAFADKLKSAFQKQLPGISAHKRMVPTFPGKAPEYFNHGLKLCEAAVLIILFEEEGRIKTVFIERTPDAGPHSGQIAFPGGRKEDFDSDLIETALREANEEVGVNIDRNNCIGKLTPVQIQISGFSVLPVICFTENTPEFTICEAEVRNIFVADLYDLLDSETDRFLTVRGMEIKAPCYILDDKIVWGATAMVLSELDAVNSQNLGQ